MFCSDSRDAWILFLFGLCFSGGGGFSLVWSGVGGFLLDLVLERGVFCFGIWKPVVPLGGLGILPFSNWVFLHGDYIYSILEWKGFVWAVLLLSRTKLEGWFQQFFLPLEKGCIGYISFSGFFSFPCYTESRVSRVIFTVVSTFKLFAGGFWMVRTILSTFFTYSLSCALTFMVPKPLADVVMEGIGNISVNFHFLLNFKFRWGFRSNEGKDVGVGVNKLVIFSYCNLFSSDTCFLKLCLISLMEQEDSSELHYTLRCLEGSIWIGFNFHIVEGGHF